MAQAGGQNQYIVIIVILVLVILLRIRRIVNGTKVSLARTVGFSAYYVAFASFFILYSYTEGISADYFILFALVFAAGAYLSFRTVGSYLHFWKTRDGAIYSKGGMLVYLIYIVGLFARIGIEYIFIPGAFGFSQTPIKLSPAGLVALIATDILLAIGTGLLFGRNMKILKRYFAIKRGEERIIEESK